MSSVLCFLLLTIIFSINAELVLHSVGKFTVVVKEEQLHVVVSDHTKCKGDLDIHYDVTKVTNAQFAVAGDDKLCRVQSLGGTLVSIGYDGKSKCPLAKSSDNHLEINVVSLPADCVVTLKNADVTSTAPKQTEDGTLHLAVIIGSVLGALILIGLAVALFVWFVGRSWWGRRQERKRRPVESPVNGPSSLLKMPEETNTRKRNGKKNKENAEPKAEKAAPATATPTPSTTSAVPPPSHANPGKPNAAPVPPAVGTKAAEAPKTRSTDKKFSGYRAQEPYNAIRARGSIIAEKPAGSKKSQKTDSLEEHYMHVESAVESMARHGFVQQTMGDAAILSRRESKTIPQAFLDMQKWYGKESKHQMDARELTLLTTFPQDSYGLLEELSTEARTKLMAEGVTFSADSRHATFTKEARAFVSASTTPAFVMLVAFGAEFGYLVRLQELLPERERDFHCYSIQLLLLIALNQANTERIRREALAFMMVKISRQLPKYAASQLDEMAFPMSLVSEVMRSNPEFYKHPEKFQTGWKDTDGCCNKKATAEPTSTPAQVPAAQQEKQLEKRATVTTATTKTSITDEK